MPGAASAASKLSISPTRIDVQARPGDTVVRSVRVGAIGDEDLVVEFTHADFGFDDESYSVVLIRDEAPQTTAFSTRGWFSVPRRRIKIPARQTVDVPLTIEVPDNAVGGTSLGAALFRTALPQDSPGSRIAQRSEAGPLVFITVAGGTPPRPTVARFRLPRFVASGPIQPHIRIGNAGDGWFAYQGTIGIRGEASKVTIGRQVVVPNSPRDLTVTADRKDEKDRPKLGADLGFGRHTVELRLEIEPTGATLVTSRALWVVPRWMWWAGSVLALTLAAGLVLLGRWVVARRRVDHPVAELDTDEHQIT